MGAISTLPSMTRIEARRLLVPLAMLIATNHFLTLFLAGAFLLSSTLPLGQISSANNNPKPSKVARKILAGAPWKSGDSIRLEEGPDVVSGSADEDTRDHQGSSRNTEAGRPIGLRKQAFVPLEAESANNSRDLRLMEVLTKATFLSLLTLAIISLWRRRAPQSGADKCAEYEFEERRKEPRMRTRHRVGMLLASDSYQMVECLVLDRSCHGARVRVSEVLPQNTSIRFIDGNECMMYRARIAWSHENDMGLQLTPLRRVNRARYWPSRVRTKEGLPQ